MELRVSFGLLTLGSLKEILTEQWNGFVAPSSPNFWPYMSYGQTLPTEATRISSALHVTKLTPLLLTSAWSGNLVNVAKCVRRSESSGAKFLLSHI